MRRWLRNGAVLFTVVAGAISATASEARADVVLETPWHPAAAAYRTMVFLCNLKPEMWDLIRETYDHKHPAAAIDKPSKAFFDSLPDRGETMAKAIASENCQALYEAATRAVSQLTRKSLAEATEALPEPGKAYQKVLDAQAIYRAVADFVAQADPDGGRRVGTAWLELTSSVGSKGVLGVGVVAADREAFAAARKIIDEYLAANFEPPAFKKRKGLTPLPETVVAARGEVEVRPWLPPGSNLNDQDPLPKLVLNFEEQGIEESDLPIVAYGDMIFDSPLVFADPAKSLGIACSTCHNRSDITNPFSSRASVISRAPSTSTTHFSIRSSMTGAATASTSRRCVAFALPRPTAVMGASRA